MNDKLNGQVRAALTAIAGILVSVGWANESVATGIVSVGMYVVAAVWSWQSKKKNPLTRINHGP